jgi:PAS domain S-box-containing protein
MVAVNEPPQKSTAHCEAGRDRAERISRLAGITGGVAGDQIGLSRRREPDLSGMAAFSVNLRGQVISWPPTAATLFGYPAQAVIGHDVCDVLMTGPGHRELAEHALSEVAVGRVARAWRTGRFLPRGDIRTGRMASMPRSA